MHKLLSLSSILCFLCLMISSSCGNATTLPFSYYENFCVVDGTRSKEDTHWTDYLERHLKKRCLSSTLISRNFTKSDNNVKITVHLDPDMDEDYSLERNRTEIALVARTNKIMTWLIYQFVAGVAQDDGRFDASDLPPAVIDVKTQEGTMAFELRSIYSPTNADGEMLDIRGTNHIDCDWALWGHNIWKVIGDEHTDDVYSKVDGNVNREQFCFSSYELYDLLEKWILENYGEGNGETTDRFTIMPQDNNIVCNCDLCKKAGNTAKNATPAVTAMLVKLAKRFPKHFFFTSAYNTTVTPPTNELPSNVGVFISAIDVPMVSSFATTEGYTRFAAMLDSWKKVCNKIYIWEYSQNYDDYITPYPCLSILQKRLQAYRDSGVKGVFVNGSGDDYSTFDDLRTFVLSALLINPDLNVETLISRFFQVSYPASCELLTPYVLSIEQKAAQSTKALSFYDGIGMAVHRYLDPVEFDSFWTSLDAASKEIQGDERQRLNQLLTSLSFTRMELVRLNPAKAEENAKSNILEVLADYASVPGLVNYREADGPLEQYVEECKTLPFEVMEGDKIRDVELGANDLKNEDLGVDCLTDGILGFPTDYHMHWLISGVNEWRLNLANPISGTMHIRFLVAPRWRMYMPQKIAVFQNGHSVYTSEPVNPSESKEYFQVNDVAIPLTGIDNSAPIDIVLSNSSRPRSTIACDEITIY